MTLLPGKHPREKTWSHYQCDGCKDAFWGPRDGNGGADVKHVCAECRGVRSSHYPTHRYPTERTDIDYHGGQFNKGEW